MQNYSEFGIEARGIMLAKGMTMTALANELDISVAYLSDILRGTRRGTKQKKKIAQILEMDK